MSSDERLPNETLPLPSSPTTTLDYSRSVSQDLRDLDDALTHAIDQLTKFNSETMSDLSLKYELIRNNESRVIGFFARQLMILQMQKLHGHNGGFHSEYSKLDRFLSALNLNKKSIEYIVQRLTFDDFLNDHPTFRDQVLGDAQLSENERKDVLHAITALKNCIDYLSAGGTNDNGRFYWHTETPTSNIRQHRLSDTVLSSPITTDSVRSTSFSSSISTEFPPNNLPTINPSPYNVRRPPAAAHTPPPSRLNHLNVNGSKGKCEHPSKKSSVDPTIFTTTTNASRNVDLQLPDGGNSSRRSSYGSDSESRLPSGSATPMSPTIRSPTMSGSPLGSAQNSDTENEPRSDGPTYNTSSPILRHRMAHKIQHKFDRTHKIINM